MFLSIGYSTCHWCHVMAHESFEDPEIAAMLNETFINIKVDKEERPDLNEIYMTACQIMTGQGGWPLTIILMPDQRPFYAATYIPKDSRFGRIGLRELLPRIAELWRTQRQQLLRSSEEVSTMLLQQTGSPGAEEIHTGLFERAYEQLAATFDEIHGGFGEAPKFPSPHTLLFLLRYWKRSGQVRALDMVKKTVRMMRRGGIYDHIGYGFHRYSTDQIWLVPHFEKMLYDQAMMILVCAETWQASGDRSYKNIADEILSYLLRDMTSELGGFYSAEDADSEGEEGKFYLWTDQELKEVLGEDDATFAAALYNVKGDGNFVEEATRRQSEHNILHVKKSPEKLAADLDISPAALAEREEKVRKRLFEAREQRPRPHKDDKILADWNGLMIAALAKAAQLFSDDRYTAAATKAMDFILTVFLDEGGRLSHRYRDGEVAIEGFLDDYSFTIWGLLELYELTFNISYLSRAVTLFETLLDEFWDEEHGGFFFTSSTAENALMRPKNIYDGAIPSGNSVAFLLLLRIGRMTGDQEYERKAVYTAQHAMATIRRNPAAYAHFLSGLDFLLAAPVEIVFAGKSRSPELRSLIEELRNYYLPNSTVLFRPADVDSPEIVRYAAHLKDMKDVDGSAAAYVCQNYTCREPATNVEQLRARLTSIQELAT